MGGNQDVRERGAESQEHPSHVLELETREPVGAGEGGLKGNPVLLSHMNQLKLSFHKSIHLSNVRLG